jgi:hypothetical protein
MLPSYVVGVLWLATLPFWFWRLVSSDERPVAVLVFTLAIWLTLGAHYLVEWRRRRPG